MYISMDMLDDEGTPALVIACSSTAISSGVKIVQLLLERGATVNLASRKTLVTPLLAACQRGFLEYARVLIEHHADVDARGTKDDVTPLFAA